MELEETTPSGLPPENCHYQEDGCELTSSCLKCPFPGCIYAVPRSGASVHPVLEGRYQTGAWQFNRIQVEGYDSGGDTAIIVDRFSWDEIDMVYDRLEQLEDRNIGSISQAEARGRFPPQRS